MVPVTAAARYRLGRGEGGRHRVADACLVGPAVEVARGGLIRRADDRRCAAAPWSAVLVAAVRGLSIVGKVKTARRGKRNK